jgi:UDP-N-acetylmuramate--alanine ligase
VEVVIGHHPVPKDTEVVVYSDAVPFENPERMSAREYGIPEKSYFTVIGEVSETMKTIAVAGTHGKTTTTGMLTKILVHAEKRPTAIIGSIVRDFGSNCVLGSRDVFVVEACEYKDHILHITPQVLVLTNVELDHTDYFPSLEALQRTFKKAIDSVPADGYIITNPAHERIAPLLANAQAKIVDYTKESVAGINLLGEFNRENAQAARAAARTVYPDIPDDIARHALETFQGSWRRFEYKGETAAGATVYDDYAHHPTAVRKTIDAARERFSGKEIIVAFHPHLYSRTKHFADDFAEALTHADTAYIAPIYAARESHDPTISHTLLAEAVNAQGGHAYAKDSLHAVRDALTMYGSGAVVITMGAGDIYKVADELVA